MDDDVNLYGHFNLCESVSSQPWFEEFLYLGLENVYLFLTCYRFDDVLVWTTTVDGLN